MKITFKTLANSKVLYINEDEYKWYDLDTPEEVIFQELFDLAYELGKRCKQKEFQEVLGL